MSGLVAAVAAAAFDLYLTGFLFRSCPS